MYRRFSRRCFLRAAGVTGILGSRLHLVAGQGTFLPNSAPLLKRHNLKKKGPTPSFFEGMLLGNGDLGLCITVRPDALVLHLGKNDVWDIRVSKEHLKYVRPFQDLMQFFKRLSNEVKARGAVEEPYTLEHPELEEYVKKVRSSYRKPWPRPWPCGQLILHWDPRLITVDEQELDLVSGLFSLELKIGGKRARILSLLDRTNDGIILWAEDMNGRPAWIPIRDAVFYAHRDPRTGMPEPIFDIEGSKSASDFVFRVLQRLPFTPPSEDSWKAGEMVWGRIQREGETAAPAAPEDPRDQFLSVFGRLHGNWRLGKAEGAPSLSSAPIQLLPPQTEEHPLQVRLFVQRSDTLSNASSLPKWIVNRSDRALQQVNRTSRDAWEQFWSQSAISLADSFLEQVWYRNQYWLACAVDQKKVAPGLFGNWMSGNIGTAWHGDYHMNYNTQQVFWGTLSSNHPEQNLSYVDLCWHLLPIAKDSARRLFNLPGAYFPHSAYPVPSQVNPYPVPPWAYQLSETPWTVQGAWWQYLYTQDQELLRDRIYPLLREAAIFCAAYLQKGPDGLYHAPLSVSPEKYGITVDLRYNQDVIIDLALLRFLFDAVLEADQILGVDGKERQKWAEIRAHLPEYPRAMSEEGVIWTDVAGGPAETVYNVPVSLAPVFPGEQVGLHSSAEELEIARRTARHVRLEGGNDLVFMNLILARLGILDLDTFKREIAYALLPNGTCADRVRQVGGRYMDSTDFDFMADMGIWIENLGLPAVMNECLMQSYNGVIRLFPNPGHLEWVSFEKLRAVGAFLVSSRYERGKTVQVVIESLAGKKCRIYSPWSGETKVWDLNEGLQIALEDQDGQLEFRTMAGHRYRLEKQLS